MNTTDRKAAAGRRRPVPTRAAGPKLASQPAAADGEGAVLDALPDEWSGPETTVAELVPGLDTIAPLAIAYSRLPGRAKTVYAPRYRLWSDIADEPVTRVLTAPGAAYRTLRALLALAQETVTANRAAATRRQLNAHAAATQLFDRLDIADRTLLTDLIFPNGPRDYQQVIAKLGVNTGWIHRHLPSARAQLTELLAEPVHRDVTVHVEQLRRELGPLLPAQHLTACLARRRLNHNDPAALMLLYLAGPYTARGDWWESRSAGGADAIMAIVDQAFSNSPTLTISDLTKALVAAGMNPAVVPVFLDAFFPLRTVGRTVTLWSKQSVAAQIVCRSFDSSPTQTIENLTGALTTAGLPASLVPAFLDEFFPLKTFGEICVRWDSTTGSQVEGILQAHGSPMTAHAIYSHLDSPRPTMNTMLTRLSDDRRFMRASKKSWALRAWDHLEYFGIVEAIDYFLDEAGGELTTAEVVAHVTTAFPDVSEPSVRKFLCTLAYININGSVRRRTRRDPWPTPEPLNTVHGAFRNGPHQIRMGVIVDADMLRGSGAPVAPAVATAIGVEPGAQATFSSPAGPVLITWHLASTHGPRRGSVRRLAQAVGAAAGDTLVLAFDLAQSSLTPTRIPAHASRADALAELTGLDTLSLVGLAASLDCAPAQVAQILAGRGDTELAEAARLTASSPPVHHIVG